MAEITAAMVKELREKTGAGMMDCKKALNEVGADLEAAVDWLRKKGLAAAAKKAGRVAAEGLVGVVSTGTVGAVLEVNAETDFVARNEKFQDFVSQVTKLAANHDLTLETLKTTVYGEGDATVESFLTQLIAVIGENMSLRRLARLSVNQGVVASYIHNSAAPGVGKIGVLVALESTGNAAELADLGKKIAMHVAAANPQALAIADVDPAALDRERAVLADQARASGRPEEIIEKMVEGRIRKYYEEIVLLEQAFVLDPQSKISQVVETASKALGAPIQLTGFVRYALGEGIEKAETDFAAEVQAQAAGNR